MGSTQAIADTKADIILEPLTQVLVSSAPLKISNSVFGEHLLLHREDATNSSSIKFTNTAGTAGILYGRHSDNELVWRDGTTTNNFMLWHEGNDGSGSGLDADTVDGLEAASFLRSNDSDIFTGGYLRFNNNSTLRFGTGSDFRIFHNGTDTVFRNYLHGSNTFFQGEDTAGNNHAMIYLRQDNAAPNVQLFYDGVEAFRTAAGGLGLNNNAENELKSLALPTSTEFRPTSLNLRGVRLTSTHTTRCVSARAAALRTRCTLQPLAQSA